MKPLKKLRKNCKVIARNKNIKNFAEAITTEILDNKSIDSLDKNKRKVFDEKIQLLKEIVEAHDQKKIDYSKRPFITKIFNDIAGFCVKLFHSKEHPLREKMNPIIDDLKKLAKNNNFESTKEPNNIKTPRSRS